MFYGIVFRNDSTHCLCKTSHLVNSIWLKCAVLCKILLVPWFAIIVVSYSPACGECCSWLWHICRYAPWPEETPSESECFWRARLLSFLFFCFLFVLHTGWFCALCPRILSVLQYPRAQAGLLLLQRCCGTRRCEETHTNNKHTLNPLTHIIRVHTHSGNKQLTNFPVMENTWKMRENKCPGKSCVVLKSISTFNILFSFSWEWTTIISQMFCMFFKLIMMLMIHFIYIALGIEAKQLSKQKKYI